MSTTTSHRRQGLSTPSLPLLWGMLAFLAFSLGGGDAFDAETMNFCSLRMGADPDLSEQECTRRLTTMIPDRLCLRIAGGTDEEIDWPTCIDITVLQAQIRAFRKRRQAPRAGECLEHVYILRLTINFAPLFQICRLVPWRCPADSPYSLPWGRTISPLPPAPKRPPRPRPLAAPVRRPSRQPVVPARPPRRPQH